MYLARVVISHKKNPTLTRRGIPPLLTRKETKNMLFNVMRMPNQQTLQRYEFKTTSARIQVLIILIVHGKHVMLQLHIWSILISKVKRMSCADDIRIAQNLVGVSVE